jgi:hypothetical protein
MLLLVTTALAGCAVDGTGGSQAPEDVASASAAVSTSPGFPTYWETGNGSGDWGSAANQTCFMSGLTGEFGGTPGWTNDFGAYEPPVYSSAGLTLSNGNWVYKDASGGGTGVGFYFECLQGQTANRCIATASSNSKGQSSPGYCNANPNGSTRCFLLNIASAGVSAPNMNVAISGPTDGFFTINANMEAIGGDNNTQGYASMVCVDISPIKAGWGFGTGVAPTNSQHTASASILLRNSYPSGAQVPVSGVACGLTAVAGDWSLSPDPLGWGDGVYPVNAGGFWQYNFTNGRSGSISCVE